MNRPRRYSIVTINEAMQKGGYRFHLTMLKSVAFRTLCINGSVFLRADQCTIDSYVETLAAKRKLPPRANGKPYRCLAVMDTGERVRLQAYEREVASMPANMSRDVTADLAQAPPFGKAVEIIPTIIKNSRMYSLKEQRFFLPEELLCAQGVAMHGDEDRLKEGVQQSLLELPKGVPQKALMNIVGNSMHLAQVGVTFGVALMNAL